VSPYSISGTFNLEQCSGCHLFVQKIMVGMDAMIAASAVSIAMANVALPMCSVTNWILKFLKVAV
jgi:hypothetical protein